jgi:hypothetical protein
MGSFMLIVIALSCLGMYAIDTILRVIQERCPYASQRFFYCVARFNSFLNRRQP